MGNPTYSFEEVVERLRQASDPEETILIGQLVEEEMEGYCHFHARLIVEAIRQKKLFFQSLSH